jgi:hypothetical protein
VSARRRDLRLAPFWTSADEAEAQAVYGYAAAHLIDHSERCGACRRRVPCLDAQRALDEVVVWRQVRALLSYAAYLRRRLEDGAPVEDLLDWLALGTPRERRRRPLRRRQGAAA